MPKPQSIALIDAESFYASCEAAFDPKLRGKPIVVLFALLNSVRIESGDVIGPRWHLQA